MASTPKAPPLPPPPDAPDSISFRDSSGQIWIWNPLTGQVFIHGGGKPGKGSASAGGGNIAFADAPDEVKTGLQSKYDAFKPLFQPAMPEFHFPEMPEPPPPPAPPPPPPPPPSLEVDSAAKQSAETARLRTASNERRRRGRASTILTGSQGLLSPAPTQQPTLTGGKTLLGQ